jgi:hypothetical protein
LRFRNEQFGAGRVREVLSRFTAFELPSIVEQRVDLGRFVALEMIGSMAKNPLDMLGPRRPVADPGREVQVKGDLDAVIAAGMGFNLDEIRKRSQDVGVLAALSQVQAPIANREGQIPIDQNSIASLRGALTGELEQVLNVAAPPIIRRPRAGRRGAQAEAAPVRDALDELIERASEQPAAEEES